MRRLGWIILTAVGAGLVAGALATDHLERAYRLCDRVAKRGESPRAFVDSLRRGETGCLPAGRYVAKRKPIRFARRRVTLRGVPGQRATVRGMIRIGPKADGVTIRGLDLNGRNVDGNLSPLIYADGVVLRDNDITNGHTAICIHVDAYPGYPPPSGVVIEGNRIHDCGRLPATNQDHGVYLGHARDAVVRNNWIYRNADRGIQL